MNPSTSCQAVSPSGGRGGQTGEELGFEGPFYVSVEEMKLFGNFHCRATSSSGYLEAMEDGWLPAWLRCFHSFCRLPLWAAPLPGRLAKGPIVHSTGAMAS